MTENKLLFRRAKGFRDHWRIWKLYRKSFPVNERKPFRIICRYEKRGKTDLWIFENRGRFSGFAATLNGENAVLLDYLAVLPECRGQGIGSFALQKLLLAYRGNGFFVEIENAFSDSADKSEREKRRSFYLNNGFSPLNVFASVFGVEMELLGVNMRLTFEEYRAFYKNNYSAFAAQHVKPIKFPPEGI